MSIAQKIYYWLNDADKWASGLAVGDGAIFATIGASALSLLGVLVYFLM